MKYEEKTINSHLIHQGKILNVRVDEVRLPDGGTSMREIVEHDGAVAIVALNEHHELLLVKQFRKPIETTTIEIPAGKLEKNEAPLACAKRELIEETGFDAKNISLALEIFPSPGFCNEKIYLYLASELVPKYLEKDEDEFMDLITVTPEKAALMIQQGLINDSKTIIGIYHYLLHHHHPMELQS